jgi:ribosomal protein L7/L12
MKSMIMTETASRVTERDKQLINQEIEKAIQKINQRGQLTLLTMESISALTAGEARWRELNEQGSLKRVFRTLTGKNNKIRDAMQRDIFHFQYIAQKTLQELADQQCFTLDLVAAVHNKLNLLIREADKKFEIVYHHLHAFFDDTEGKLLHIHDRLDRLEKNVDILYWQATIEYRQYHGKPYVELTDIEKMVCLTSDFFSITKGKWLDQDLLLLEVMFKRLKLPEVITLYQFFYDLSNHPSLAQHLLEVSMIDEKEEIQLPELPVIAAIQQVAFTNPSQHPFEGIKQMLIQKAMLSLETPISVRNLVFELINGLEAARELGTIMNIETSYTVVLNQIKHRDTILDVVRELRTKTKLPLDECKVIARSTPSRVITYQTYEEAQILKHLLEKHGCEVEIE